MNYIIIELLLNKHYISNTNDILSIKNINHTSIIAFNNSCIKKYLSSQYLINYLNKLGLNCCIFNNWFWTSKDLIEIFNLIGNESFDYNNNNNNNKFTNDDVDDYLYPIKNYRNNSKINKRCLYRRLTRTRYMDSIINYPGKPKYLLKRYEMEN